MATEWNGEGIPPVGTECEAAWGEGSEWLKCVIVSAKAIAYFHRNEWHIGRASHVNFRPLQSEEQKQVAEIAEIMQKNNSYQGKAQAVYNAGFRKVVE